MEKGGNPLVLVMFLFFSWLCLLVFVCLPKKLPLSVNFLLFMVLEVILTNKLTIIGFTLRLFTISQDIPRFLSLILHNDVTITTVLLTFTNVFLTARSRLVKLLISLYAFLFQLFLGMTLIWNHVLTDNRWNLGSESLMIVLLTAFSLLSGKVLQSMAAREGWVR